MRDDSKMWVMSNLELNICMQMSGCRNWDYFPVYLEQQPLEQRILRAFMNLNRMGFLESEGEKYVPTKQLEIYFQKAVDPDYVLQVLEKDSMPVLYEVKGKECVVMEQVFLQKDLVRIYLAKKEECLQKLLKKPFSQEETVTVFESLTRMAKAQKAVETLLVTKKGQQKTIFVWKAADGLRISEEKKNGVPFTIQNFWNLVEGTN